MTDLKWHKLFRFEGVDVEAAISPMGEIVGVRLYVDGVLACRLNDLKAVEAYNPRLFFAVERWAEAQRFLDRLKSGFWGVGYDHIRQTMKRRAPGLYVQGSAIWWTDIFGHQHRRASYDTEAEAQAAMLRPYVREALGSPCWHEI